ERSRARRALTATGEPCGRSRAAPTPDTRRPRSPLSARQSSGHHPDFAWSSEPDRDGGDDAAGAGETEGQRVAAGRVVKRGRDPGTDAGAGDGETADGAEDGAEVGTLEELGRNGAEDGRQAVAERALRQHHGPQKRRRGMGAKRDQGDIADDEA